MTNQSKRYALTVFAMFASMGVLGWMMWKVGAVDFVLGIVVQMALLFPMMAVAFGILDASAFNMMVEETSSIVARIGQAFSRGETVIDDDCTQEAPKTVQVS